jgi:hypothetical protein
MKFAIVDSSGTTLKLYERHIPLLDENTIDVADVQGIIELVLDTFDIEYEHVENPIFHTIDNYWTTHRLCGEYTGYSVRLFL